MVAFLLCGLCSQRSSTYLPLALRSLVLTWLDTRPALIRDVQTVGYVMRKVIVGFLLGLPPAISQCTLGIFQPGALERGH